MTLRVGVFDYGAGNLHSFLKAIEAFGASTRVYTDCREALSSDALVLPGVGSFATASSALGDAGDEVRAALAEGLPCLGICLGMQVLFEGSDEAGGPGIAAAVRRGRCWGTQFHPEKSSRPGLRIIANFLAEAAR